MKWIQSLHFRLRFSSLLFDWKFFAQVEPPQLEFHLCSLKNFCWKLWYSFVTFGDKISSTLEKCFDILRVRSQDARCDVVWLGRLILEGWFVLRIPMMAMSMVISGLDDARRHQSDRQTNNQHARAIRIGGSYGVFLDSWHPRAQPWLPHV